MPLTSALRADIYGLRALSTIYGLLYAIVPLGSELGSALAGVLFDHTGSYSSSILINVAAGPIAAVTVATARSTLLFERQPERQPSGAGVRGLTTPAGQSDHARME